jgi:hypothetical protein
LDVGGLWQHRRHDIRAFFVSLFLSFSLSVYQYRNPTPLSCPSEYDDIVVVGGDDDDDDDPSRGPMMMLMLAHHQQMKQHESLTRW